MRRPVAGMALIAAAIASVATTDGSIEDSDPIVYAEGVSGVAFLLSAERPEWRFVILTETTLPPEWAQDDPVSELVVSVEPQIDAAITARLLDCEDDAILDEAASRDLVLDGVFDECPFGEACLVRTCLVVASDGTSSVPVQWTVQAGVTAPEARPVGFVPVTVAIAEDAP